MRSIIIAIVFFILSGLPAQSPAASTVGSPAPDFTLNDLKGHPVKLSAYKGSKVVVLGLFHICDPCRKQTVELQKIFTAYKDKGVEVIGVNASGDSMKDVSEFLATVPGGVGFDYLLDPKTRLEIPYGIRATPNILIVDKQGTIRFRGAFVPASMIESELKKIL
jgi:cytochrome c biogenesis protein CcmG, thiol:disulfide interchange protein DsbE